MWDFRNDHRDFDVNPIKNIIFLDVSRVRVHV